MLLAFWSFSLFSFLPKTVWADYPAPEYALNLDLDPVERWKPIVMDFMTELPPVIDTILEDLVYLSPIVKELMSVVQIPEEYLGEMQGIAEQLNTDPQNNYTLDQVLECNLYYELTTWCTSIVAQHTNGTVYHARNQDLSLTILKTVLADVSFTRQGETVYKGTTFIGYVGLPTALRPGVWSASLNAHYELDDLHGPQDNIQAAKDGGLGAGMFLRSAMNQAKSFWEAVNYMSNWVLIAPMYITMAGANPGEGAVVTRTRYYALDVWTIQPYSRGDDQWFRVETNYDHWHIPPPWDDRRWPAEEGMLAMGQDNVSLANMYEVLSTPPVYAWDTLYTATIVPAWGEYDATVRDGPPSDDVPPAARS